MCVFLTCTLTYLQGRQTSSVMSSFLKMLPAQTTVIRDGKESRVPAEELTLGDIVRLGLGDRVPADLRIIDHKELKVEMSSMTGEPDAIACFVEKKHDMPAEARNLVFNSALVMKCVPISCLRSPPKAQPERAITPPAVPPRVRARALGPNHAFCAPRAIAVAPTPPPSSFLTQCSGEARGVVMRIGDQTMIGKIAGLASSTTTVRSNMEVEVEKFVHQVTLIALATSVVFVAIGCGQDQSPTGIIAAFVNGFILVMVAYVPEGLPATVASCMTIAAQRMAVRHVFVKRPDIIEALGAATVIASDKTGTLTQNKMTVENMWVNKQAQNVRSVVKRNAPDGGAALALDAAEIMAAGRNIGAQDLEGNTRMQPTLRGKGELGTVGRGGSGGTIGRGTIGRGTIGKAGNNLGGAYGSFSNFRTFTKNAGSLTHVSWERSSPYMRLVIMSGVCNRARFVEDEAAAGDADAKKIAALSKFKAARKVLGDASDAALLRFVDNAIQIEELRGFAFPTLFEIPFNSVNKWSMAVVRDPGAPEGSPASHVAMLKGAPEVILARCTTYLHNGREKEIDDEFRDEYQQAYERFAFMGERVLGFAYKTFAGARDPTVYRTDESGLPKEQLCFLGLVSLVDPPRDGVAEAVAKCRSASIRVTMVTGDHPLTAEAIARKVGIITLPTQREIALLDDVDEHDIPLSDPRVRAVVRAGHEIRDLPQSEWDLIISKDEAVFARTTPQQKLEIVENYQRLGHVVAVTGDGVNDSPALKKANIGVAMGSAEASDVAREAADIVLMDDNFASIVAAIEEGRTLFDNLKKSIAYTIAHTIPELFPLILNIWFGLPLALPGLIFLTIDLLTEQGPAISFAYEKAEDSVMDRPPRKMGKDLLVSRQLIVYSYITTGLASSLVCMLAFFLVYIYHGLPVSYLWMSRQYFKSDGSAPDLVVAGGKTFSGSDQWAVYTESVAAYYGTIVANQVFHVFVCKTRFVSIWSHGLLSNPVTLGGVACALALAVFFIYVPGVQVYFFTNALMGAIWLCSLIYAVFIFAYSEWVKLQSRQHPDGWAATQLNW